MRDRRTDMKYAIQVLMRFDTKEERDAVAEKLKKKLKKTFDNDDSFIQKHICYHDEDPTKPCVVEEIINYEGSKVLAKRIGRLLEI